MARIQCTVLGVYDYTTKEGVEGAIVAVRYIHGNGVRTRFGRAAGTMRYANMAFEGTSAEEIDTTEGEVIELEDSHLDISFRDEEYNGKTRRKYWLTPTSAAAFVGDEDEDEDDEEPAPKPEPKPAPKTGKTGKGRK